MICPRLECKAALSRPRMNCDGVANVKVLVRMVPRRSMRSRLCSARLMVASFGTVLAVLDGACCCCSAGGAAVFAVWVTSARVELVELVEEVLLSLLLSLLLSWDAVLGLQASPFGSVGGGWLLLCGGVVLRAGGHWWCCWLWLSPPVGERPLGLPNVLPKKWWRRVSCTVAGVYPAVSLRWFNTHGR